MNYTPNSVLWLESRNKRWLSSRALSGSSVVMVFPLVPARGLSLFLFLCLCWCVQADVLQMCRLSLSELKNVRVLLLPRQPLYNVCSAWLKLSLFLPPVPTGHILNWSPNIIYSSRWVHFLSVAYASRSIYLFICLFLSSPLGLRWLCTVYSCAPEYVMWSQLWCKS